MPKSFLFYFVQNILYLILSFVFCKKHYSFTTSSSFSAWRGNVSSDWETDSELKRESSWVSVSAELNWLAQRERVNNLRAWDFKNKHHPSFVKNKNWELSSSTKIASVLVTPVTPRQKTFGPVLSLRLSWVDSERVNSLRLGKQSRPSKIKSRPIYGTVLRFQAEIWWLTSSNSNLAPSKIENHSGSTVESTHRQKSVENENKMSPVKSGNYQETANFQQFSR